MADFTTDDLKAINEAIGSGALEVEYNDRRVKYRSMNELMRARDVIKKSLGLKKNGARILCNAKKGTC